MVVQPSWSCLPWRWLGWKTTGDALVSPKISWLVGIGARLRCAPSGRGRWSPVEERELEKIRRGEQSQSSRARRAVRGFNLPPREPRSGGSSYIRRNQILCNASVNFEIFSHLKKQKQNLTDLSNMPHDGKRSSEMNEAPLFQHSSLIHRSSRSCVCLSVFLSLL